MMCPTPTNLQPTMCDDFNLGYMEALCDRITELEVEQYYMDYMELVNELRYELEVEYYYDNKYSDTEYDTIGEVLQNIPQTNERNYLWWVGNDSKLDYEYASDIFQPAKQITVITQYYFNIVIHNKNHEYSFHCDIDKAAYDAYVSHADMGATYSYNELMEQVNKIYRVVNRANRLGSWLSENV